MRAGEVVADRFELERLAGEGGMGAVWRARDRESGEIVALKLVTRPSEGARFAREIAVLSALDHPAIVRYVGHGVHSGSPWVAMEWLEGADLEVCLRSGTPPLASTLALGRRIASALAAVHAAGLVHRDVKPSNILLVGGRLEDAKLVDFGIVRSRLVPPITREGAVIGTPGYMAPEQARGDSSVGTAADVFSLGCVLYECLTGVPAFSGHNLVAILAKVLMQEAPRLSEVLTNVPEALDALVARMLDKDPGARPPDGAALERELAVLLGSLDERPRAEPLVPRRISIPLSTSESQIASVVLIGRADGVGATLNAGDVTEELARLRTVALRHSAEIELLADGSILALSIRRGTSKERAVAAARLALALREPYPGQPCALATGRAALGDALPVGEAIDRVARLVREESATGGVRIDETTAGLLDERFEINGGLLVRERDVPEPERRVLGRSVQCVGRDSELALIESLYDRCVSEPRSTALVVMAPAGMGKTRLVHEAIERLRRAGRSFRVRMGRGDPMSAGSPLAIPRDALRRFFAVEEGVAPGAMRERIVDLVATRVKEDTRRVAWFVGEMMGVPFDESEDVAIAAARRDPRLMADQVRRAFEDLVLAEASLGPLIVMLDDLHWGDAATVSFIESTLRLGAALPLFVIATGRPELDTRFPNLWSARRASVIHLRELTAAASSTLVRAVMPDVSDDRVAALVGHAAGNPLFLEEMLRAEADGRGTETPGTVLAMMTSSLELLPPELRGGLRAASVFGRTFWRGAIEDLVGLAAPLLDALLDALVDRELVLPVRASRVAGEREYAFRHDLVREAAYALLTDEDRALAHRHAGMWLERAGEIDASVLAEHFEAGGERERAVRWWVRAARQSREANDLAEVIARGERAIACGAQGAVRAEVRAAQSGAAYARGDAALAYDLAERGLSDATRGFDPWAACAAAVIATAQTLGHSARAEEVARDLADVGAAPAGPLFRAATHLLVGGAPALAATLAARAGTPVSADERYLQHCYRATRRLFEGDPAQAVVESERALEAATDARDLRAACSANNSLGNARKELGDMEGAHAALTAALTQAERLDLAQLGLFARQNIAHVQYCRGRFAESIALQREVAEGFRQAGDTRMEAGSLVYLALALGADGRLEDAEDAARAAWAVAPSAWLRAYAGAARAIIATRRGRAPEVLELARSGLEFLEGGGQSEEGEALVRLAWAEALLGSGDRDAARAAAIDARRRILDRAGSIQSPAYRRTFLESIPEHARTLALAAELDAAS